MKAEPSPKGFQVQVSIDSGLIDSGLIDSGLQYGSSGLSLGIVLYLRGI
jgi:hypothetical protein